MSKFDLRELRNAFGTFLTGVTVVTSREKGGIPRGFTANSFTSVSLDPPMLLICVGKAAESIDVFRECSNFAVNILTEDQVDISGLFASKRADKFDIASWTEGSTGCPILEGVCAWFDCKHSQVMDAGDHIILIGEVVDFNYTDAIGLGYVRGGYMSLGLERSIAKVSDDESVVVGAIIEHEGRVLLVEDPHSHELNVPASGLDGSAGSMGKFQSYIDKLKITVTISALYSVYENEDNGQQFIYYRASANSEGSENKFYGFNEIPWDRIKSPPIVTMLKRYIDESQRQRFGVYFGNEKDGSVKTLSE